jgi:MYXO-CTERM domain-containing protein
MLTKTNMLATIAVVAAAAIAGSAQAATIAVLDSVSVGSPGALYDLSTDGDDITGITGTFSASTEPGFPNNSTGSFWNAPGDAAASRGYITGSNTATWAFSGLPSDTLVEVFVNWNQGGQNNNATDASYSVNGSAAVLKNHKLAVPADLVLTDPDNDATKFASLGTYNSGVAGEIQIVLTEGSAFSNVDAAAISFVADSVVPEPASLSMGLVGLALIAGRRRR